MPWSRNSASSHASAGADIAEFSESVKAGLDAEAKAFVRRGQAMTARMEAFPKPGIHHNSADNPSGR